MTQIAELLENNASDPALLLLEISASNLSTPVRLVSDQQNLVHSGLTWEATALSLVLASDREQHIPSVEIAIDNVGKLSDKLLNIQNPSIVLRLILASDPGNPLISYSGLVMRSLSFDTKRISFTLGYISLDKEPFPPRTFNQFDFPSLVR